MWPLLLLKTRRNVLNTVGFRDQVQNLSRTNLFAEPSLKFERLTIFSHLGLANKKLPTRKARSITMSQFATTASYHNQSMMQDQTEMVASAMMLLSISEGKPMHTGYKSCYSQPSSCNSSGNSLSGWGSPMSRKSYKVDLSSLGASSEDMSQSISQHQSQGVSEDDTWGYFIDTTR